MFITASPPPITFSTFYEFSVEHKNVNINPESDKYFKTNIYSDFRQTSFKKLNKSEMLNISTISANIFDNLNFPTNWEKEGISKPNLDSKTKAFDICKEIYNSFSLYPNKIAATKEEGIYLQYEKASKAKSLIIEVYNTLEIAAIVSNNEQRTIEYSEDINGLFFTNAIQIFNY